MTEIKSVVNGSRAEIEVFLHGALCVCHSGQCLMSSMVGGRSGNRGECAQPCRLPYTTASGVGYPLSLKDLALAEHIPELIESGVASLKIEGRMKAPSYVYTVASVYRRLLDEGRSARPDEMALLQKAFSRQGFTDGYFVGKLQSGMTGIRSKEDKEQTRTLSEMTVRPAQYPVKCLVKIKRGEASRLTLTDGKRSVSVVGDEPMDAINHPLSVDEVTARICKTGGTALSVDARGVTVELDEGLNLSPSSINKLRREAIDAFCDFSREYNGGEYVYNARGVSTPSGVSAEFFRASELCEAYAKSPEAFSGIDKAFVPLGSEAEAVKIAGGVALPPVITDGESDEVNRLVVKAKSDGAKYALVGNIGHISFALDNGLIPVGGFRLNAYNRAARECLFELGVKDTVLSPELTLPKARDAVGGVIVYGRIPLMITERCFIKDNFGCKSCNNASLTDRMGEKFPILREFGHRNIILNSQLTYMGDKQAELRSYGVRRQHLMFTTENGEGIIRALCSIRDGKSVPGKIRRIGKRSPS